MLGGKRGQEVKLLALRMLELVPTGTRLTSSRGSVRCGACCSHSPTPKTLSAPRQKRLIGGAKSGNPKSSKETLYELQSRRRDFSQSKQTSPCPSEFFLQILPLKEFSSFPLSRPSRVATSRQAGRYFSKTASSVHPFCTFTRPQFRSPTSRHRTLWSRESSRLPFAPHRTTICALFL